MKLFRYKITCEHRSKGNVRTIIVYYVVAHNLSSALVKFMNWHDSEYKHRRAYNVVSEMVGIYL